MRIIEAIIGRDERVRLLEPVQPDRPCRALVTVFDTHDDAPHEAVGLSEAALARDWTRPEEDEAWASLQPAP